MFGEFVDRYVIELGRTLAHTARRYLATRSGRKPHEVGHSEVIQELLMPMIEHLEENLRHVTQSNGQRGFHVCRVRKVRGIQTRIGERVARYTRDIAVKEISGLEARLLPPLEGHLRNNRTIEVAKALGISWNTAQIHLYKLMAEGKVQGKRVGRQNQWMIAEKEK